MITIKITLILSFFFPFRAGLEVEKRFFLQGQFSNSSGAFDHIILFSSADGVAHVSNLIFFQTFVLFFLFFDFADQNLLLILEMAV